MAIPAFVMGNRKKAGIAIKFECATIIAEAVGDKFQAPKEVGVVLFATLIRDIRTSFFVHHQVEDCLLSKEGRHQAEAEAIAEKRNREESHKQRVVGERKKDRKG
jgi:hypothetical protein